MMTDKQLRALMEWMWAILRGSANLEKRAMYEAFGFVEDADGWPTVPTHPQTLPPATIRARDYDEAQDIATWGIPPATSDPEGHQQAITDADYDAKHAAIHALLLRNDPAVPMLETEEIMRLWPELKAIMEPNNDAK